MDSGLRKIEIFLISGSTAVLQLGVLVSGVLISRSIGVDGFDVFSVWLVVVYSLSVFSNAGMPAAISKYSIQRDGGDVKVFGIAVIVIFFCFSAVALIASASIGLIEKYFFLKYDATKFLAIAFAAALLDIIFDCLNNFSIAQGRERSYAAVHITQFFAIVFASALLEKDSSAIDASLIYVFSKLFSIVVYLFLLGDLWLKANDKEDDTWRRTGSQMVKFAIPVYFSNLLMAPVNFLIVALINRHESTPGLMSIYNIAAQFRNGAMIISGAVVRLCAPVLSRRFYLAGNSELRPTINMSIRWAVVSAGIIVLLVAALSELLLSIYTLPASMRLVFVLLILPAPLIALNSVYGQVLLAIGMSWFGFISNIIWGIAFLLLTYIFLKYYGPIGLGLSLFVSHLLQFLIIRMQIQKIMYVA